uniref:CSON014078 protein n=1 Tax=Culicoides sonorensis TaxID=179676 RepID=A0A336M9J6_CULSO
MSCEELKAPRRLSDDLENWMRNLNGEIKRTIPIINIAIPGSHDSFSYGINRKSEPAPDAEKSMIIVYKYFLPCVVRRWARTQKYQMSQQLNSGIRYFDLRTSKKDSEYYFVHGLYCEEIEKPLEDLRNFLDDHPDEFVILDCQHFYDFSHQDHIKFMQILIKAFGNRIYERIGTLLELTLDHAISQRKQLLIIYREMKHVSGKFWFSADWPTPWPNTVKYKKLEEFLENTLEQRAPTTGFTSQVVLTPDVKYIVPRFLFSLKSRLAKPLQKKIKKWLIEQQPGPFIEGEKPTCNVFLADFIDIKNSEFCKIVVDLNEKIDLSSEIDIIDCWQITDQMEPNLTE